MEAYITFLLGILFGGIVVWLMFWLVKQEIK
jgi:hypothetical protein